MQSGLTFVSVIVKIKPELLEGATYEAGTVNQSRLAIVQSMSRVLLCLIELVIV